MNSSTKRRLAKERRILRSEARWLQKALFALGKAENEHAKLLDTRGNGADDQPFDVSVDGASYPIDEVTDALRVAVEEWLELQRVSRRRGSTLAGLTP